MESSREEYSEKYKKPRDKTKKLKEKISISRRNSFKSNRGSWTLWLKYQYPDPMPIEVDPSFSIHDVKAVIQRSEEFDMDDVKLGSILLSHEGKSLHPKSLVKDALKDGDEICLSLCLPGQTISNGVNGTNNNTSTPNGGSPDLNGIRKSVGSATEGGLSPQTTLVLQSNGAPGPQYVDTELLRQTLKSINKRMERIETKLEYKNNHFDLAAKDLRLLLASLKSRPGEQTNRSAGLETDINKEIFLKLRFTLEGHTGPVNSLAQRDGLLYSGSDDNTIQVWDISTGKHRQTLQAHNKSVRSITIHNDMLISASDDETIKLWDVESLKCTNTIQLEKNACEVKASSKYLIAGFFRSVKLWDMNTGQLEKELEGMNHWVRSVRVANGYLFCGGRNQIMVWDMLNLKLIKTLESNCGSIYSMVQHGNLLFCATYENTINIFDMRTWECERLLTGHTGSVYGLVIHGNKLYSSSYDTSIRIWDLNNFQCLQRVPAHSNRIEALVGDGQNHICSGSLDRTVKIWRDNRV